MAQNFLGDQMVPKSKREKSKFLKFDVIDLSSSIPEKLLKNAILLAKKFTAVCDDTIEIILNARKSLLFNSNNEGKNW